MSAWTIEQSRKLYNIEHWGGGYFDINDLGHVTVKPNNSQKNTLDLHEVVCDIQKMGLDLPVLIRITDILKDRVNTLYKAFNIAITRHGYDGKYHPAYPIKVNQQRTVVEHMLDNSSHTIGIEVGSKPELMIALSHAKQKRSQIICNGYKDSAYIRLALIGQAIGHPVFIIIEKLSELNLILNESKKMQITPQLGVRIRLSSVSKGNWQNSGGEKSKFGLSASQTLSLIQTLKEKNRDQCLTLIHCHLGSQLANIRDIQVGLKEIARYYAELRQLSMPIEFIDVGGGLGVDYEGSRSRNYCSMNYSIQEYANDIVQAFKHTCDNSDLPHPHIITESGRAMTAHHAILVSNIVDSEGKLNSITIDESLESNASALINLRKIQQAINPNTVIESYHDAAYWLSEIQTLYTHGVMSLSQRAIAETRYIEICQLIQPLLNHEHRSHRDLADEITEKLADKYFCNLSIFQSLPDIWGINQVFPIMPIHRLNETPQKRVTLHDITCDSDGTVSQYVEKENIENTMAAHDLHPNEAYIMGFFLVGAYQEILGDMHNLFGDTHSIDISLDREGNYHLSEAESGDTVEEILSFVHYNKDQLLANYQKKIQASHLTEAIKMSHLSELKNSLKGYSYLSHQPSGA